MTMAVILNKNKISLDPLEHNVWTVPNSNWQIVDRRKRTYTRPLIFLDWHTCRHVNHKHGNGVKLDPTHSYYKKERSALFRSCIFSSFRTIVAVHYGGLIPIPRGFVGVRHILLFFQHEKQVGEITFVRYVFLLKDSQQKGWYELQYIFISLYNPTL